MKLALLATLLAFAGSLAGFQVVSAADGADRVATAPTPAQSSPSPASDVAKIPVRGHRDCPYGSSAAT